MDHETKPGVMVERRGVIVVVDAEIKGNGGAPPQAVFIALYEEAKAKGNERSNAPEGKGSDAPEKQEDGEADSDEGSEEPKQTKSGEEPAEESEEGANRKSEQMCSTFVRRCVREAIAAGRVLIDFSEQTAAECNDKRSSIRGSLPLAAKFAVSEHYPYVSIPGTDTVPSRMPQAPLQEEGGCAVM
jgi:hypothetical protein